MLSHTNSWIREVGNRGWRLGTELSFQQNLGGRKLLILLKCGIARCVLVKSTEVKKKIAFLSVSNVLKYLLIFHTISLFWCDKHRNIENRDFSPFVPDFLRS